MMRRNKGTLLLTSVVILLPALAGVLLWDRLPGQMPTHWGVSGTADGWSGKAMAVFGMPLFFLALHWITLLITSADPKKKNHSEWRIHKV